MAIESVVLEKGEEVREYYPEAHIISVPIVPPFRDGSLAFTTKRVLWIVRMGKTDVHLDFPIERVKGITINYGLLHKTVTIEDKKASYAFELRGTNNCKAESLQEIVYLPIAGKKGEIEKGNEEVVKIGMVFPPLKDHMSTEAHVLEASNHTHFETSRKMNRCPQHEKIQFTQCHRQY